MYELCQKWQGTDGFRISVDELRKSFMLEEKYDRYSAGLSALNKVKIDRVQAQTNYFNAKLELEQMIGLELEDVK